MEQGGVEKSIMQAALKRGRNTYDGFLKHLPEKMQSAPQLLPGLELFYEAFLDLSGSRVPAAAGPGSIPFSEISAWARHYDVTGETFELLVLFIRRLDAAYIGHVTKK